MLSKKNLVLILDTNILIDLVDAHRSDDLLQILRGWIASIVKMMPYNPKGRIVTLVVSTQVLNDYKSGLGHSGHNKAGKIFTNRFSDLLSHKFSVNEDNNVHLTFFKIPSKENTNSMIRDKTDRKFLALINQTLLLNKMNDRFIIFATRDASTGRGMEAALLGRKRRVRVEDSVRDLERAIEC